MRKYLFLLLFFPILLSASPTQLQQWREYLLEKYSSDTIPTMYNSPKDTLPLWQGPLEFMVNDSGGHFKQTITIHSEHSWVPIPGGEYWPQNVGDGEGGALVVLDKGNKPYLLLEKGEHVIQGDFLWEKLPQKIAVSSNTGIVLLQKDTAEYKSVPVKGGFLALNERVVATSVERESNTVQMKLYRCLVDSVPQIITTKLKLVVTGSTRDQDLGTLLPENSEIVELQSPLPAVVTPAGLLKAQLKPGEWEITLISRVKNIDSLFTVTSGGDAWPKQEIWSFKEQSFLRSVILGGVAQIDPNQTDLPEEWRSLPAFLLQKGDTLRISEKSRGDESPTPNRLSLHRSYYLDFNGTGFTLEDHISGVASYVSELSLQPPFTLGSALLNDKPHLIVEGDSGVGVQVPAGNVNLKTVNRLETHSDEVSAVGWNSSMEMVSGVLHLPPAWELLHVMGVDRAEGSQLSLWSLWDIFLLLIIVVLLFRVFDIKWAIVGFIGLLVLFHADGVPRVIWLNLLITLALLRKLPKGWWVRVIKSYYIFVAFITACMVVVLSVRTIREVVYPQIERGEYFLFAPYSPMNLSAKSDDYYVKPSEPEVLYKSNEAPEAKQEMRKKYKSRLPKNEILSEIQGYSDNSFVRQDLWDRNAVQQYKSDDIVQTGPGKPLWSWNRYTLRWDGPVEADQKIRFILVPPFVTRGLKLLAICAIALLFIRFVTVVVKEFKKSDDEWQNKKSGGTASPLPVLFCFFLLVSVVQGEEYPPQFLYDSLVKDVQKELSEVAPCYPNCASIEAGDITLGDSLFTATFIIHAQKSVAFPVLRRSQQWAPLTLSVNGKSVMITHRENLTVLLDEGVNSVTCTGIVTDNQLTLQFPTAMHNVSVSAPLWNVTGVDKGRIPGKTLQFMKREVKEENRASTIGSQPLSRPFIRIHRTFFFGREQYIQTTLTRIAPTMTPLDIKVPLVDKEAILTADLKVENDTLLVRLPADRNSFSYRSRLPMVSELTLQAPKEYSQVEEWSITSDPRYSISTKGLLAIKRQQSSEPARWSPRVGDSLVIGIGKPKAVPGKTTTFEKVTVSTVAGKNSHKTTLSCSINSSKGEPLSLRLPATAKVTKVYQDGREQVFNQKGEMLSIPLHPGKQDISVEWKIVGKLNWFTKTDKVTIGCDGANVNLHYKMPTSRWVLALGGPLMGPSMLIWGILLFFMAVALFIPKAIETPLKRYEWVLLLLGVSSVHYLGAIPVLVWFGFFSIRNKYKGERNLVYFNGAQLLLLLTTFVLFLSLAISIPVGLLSTPDMHIVGNGSSSFFYKWYQDRSLGELPQAWVVSLPLWIYRSIRLLWAVWIALSLPKWLKWGWSALNSGGFWVKRTKFVRKPTSPQPEKID